MKPIVGTVFHTGRIDFLRKDNVWVFEMIDRGMKDSQKDRIRFDPSQAPVELKSAALNTDGEPVWMRDLEQLMQTANSIFLQLRKGVLRFRLAVHDAATNIQFVTLGTQQEVNLFASQHWTNIRYFYALRRDVFQFEVNTMISHKRDAEPAAERIEILGRVDYSVNPLEPSVLFDSTGSAAAVEIVEWRSKVREGAVGRFDPENTRIDFVLKTVVRPITLLHEDRKEFRNHSYTFGGEKMRKQLKRVVAKRLKAIADQPESSEEDDNAGA